MHKENQLLKNYLFQTFYPLDYPDKRPIKERDNNLFTLRIIIISAQNKLEAGHQIT